MLTVEAYESAFETERRRGYPEVEQFEARMGYALEPDRYEPAAKVLACPVKLHAPNWQHGRVIYAATRRYLYGTREPVTLLDVGTAKGYSALCLQWALIDSGCQGKVVSVDVLSPNGRERRNTVAEVNGFKTLSEILAPWPEASAITFGHSTGVEWLTAYRGRVHVAFVDGKHTEQAVTQEAKLLSERQHAGDLVIFDDIQIPGVRSAVDAIRGYEKEYLMLNGDRGYVIAVKSFA